MNKFLRLLLTGKWAAPCREGFVSIGEKVCTQKVVEKEPDISEPVQTIIELFKDNPRDFVLQVWCPTFNKVEPTFYRTETSPTYKVTHKPSGLVAEVHKSVFTFRGIAVTHTVTYDIKLENINLTQEESKLIVDTFKSYYEDRVDKLFKLREQRLARQDTLAREKMTKLLKESSR